MLHFIIVMQICQMLENSINIWQIDILWRRVNTHWGTDKALLHAIYQLPFTQTGLAGQTAHSTAGSKEQLGMNQCQTVLYFGWRRMTKVKFYAHRANQHLSLCVGLLLSPLLKARFYTTLNKCCFVINETELYNISLPSSKATLLADVQVGAHQNLQALFCRTAFQLGVLHTFWCPGLSLPRCWTLQFLLNFKRFLPAYLFSMSRFLLMSAQPSGEPTTPPSSVSCLGLRRVHSTLPPSSRSLMKMLNRTGSSIDRWGTLLVTGADFFVPLSSGGHSTSFQSSVFHFFSE